jgi:energy-coupling factor transport system substrate-specific component
MQLIANAIAWILVAPVLDILIYSEPVNLVFTQGIVAAVSNAISTGIIGTILLVLYSRTRSQKGSLTKESEE